MMHGVKIDNNKAIQQKGSIIILQRSSQMKPNQVNPKISQQIQTYPDHKTFPILNPITPKK